MTDKIIDRLESLCKTQHEEITNWLSLERKKAAPFFYSSVDLRHSGIRLAPVDTNIFPAGFNNLSPAAKIRTTEAIKKILEKNYPDTKNILIIPENHTRNLAYFDNLAVLVSLFEKTGANARIGSLIAPSGGALEFTAASGAIIRQYPIKKEDNRLLTEDGFIPDLIILNNDMTSGIPNILQNITQPITPPVGMGWFQRHKSVHFSEYEKIIEKFSEKFGFDPWLLSAKSHQCGMVDFKNKDSLNCLAESVNEILVFAAKKHKEYNIEQKPYVFIKADSGTYGMGIMTANSANDILEINKKERNKMQVIKEGIRVSEVIIQEGIVTVDKVHEAPAEPMIYLIDGIPVGGMYRVNSNRDNFNNLNASGMIVVGMCDEKEDEHGIWKKVDNCSFKAHSLIASIAALAAGREKY